MFPRGGPKTRTRTLNDNNKWILLKFPLRARIRNRPNGAYLPFRPHPRRLGWLLWVAVALGLCAPCAYAQSSDPADQVCQRFAAGSALAAPSDLASQNGVLEVTFKFKTVVDAQGLTRYCYVTDAGVEAPTLHVLPGDQLIIHLQNTLPAAASSPPAKAHASTSASSANNDCAGGAMGPDVTNLHFHGLNVPPTCHQDEVVNTLVQPSETFDYSTQIPSDEPTGLYWYHPHPHGFSNLQVLGGATGAIIVDGIENVVPAVAGLPQRVFVLRDQLFPGAHDPQGPPLDLSVNYVAITAAAVPAVLQTPPTTSEFWRVLNASADSLLQLQYLVDGVAQPVQLVAIDGVPIGQGTGAIQPQTQTSIALSPGARAEFILSTPKAGQSAQLITQAVDTGSAGSPQPMRQLVSIVAQTGAAAARAHLGAVRTSVRLTRFADVSAAAPGSRRALYFSESVSAAHAEYYITVQGATPVAYQMGAAPSIVLHQGTTEDWIVENHTLEDHVFHIHQTRFQTLAINGQAVSDPALRDTILVPHWSGSGAYPSVKLRVDFRPTNIVGTFVYHCHILAHEDLGMMAAIQVLPSAIATTSTLSASESETTAGAPMTLTARISAASSGDAPTGTVQFFDGDTPLGAPVAVVGGRATLTAQLSSYGSHSLSAAYSGDSAHNQSLSAAVAVAVEDFALSAQSVAIQRGQSGSVPVGMTVSSGFASVVDFSCSVPATLTGASCSVSPSSLSGPGAVTLQIRTSKTAAVGSAAKRLPVTLAMLSCLILPWRRRRRYTLFALALCGVALIGVGCSSGTHPGSAGTPPGSYIVSVTGSCGGDATPITHTVSVPVQIL
jgi:FtsP/CotA-like multicopper oxidase with cupredoxin domain